MADEVSQAPKGNHNVFKAMLRGVFYGMIIALLFVLTAVLLYDFGLTNTFLTSVPFMGLFGFFIGMGMEVYPVLL